jgi:two-component system chemotaxis response regulator CheB
MRCTVRGRKMPPSAIAAELKRLRDAGAETIAQDRESSVVHGMSGEAIRLGAAKHVLAPEEIVALLRRLAG